MVWGFQNIETFTEKQRIVGRQSGKQLPIVRDRFALLLCDVILHDVIKSGNRLRDWPIQQRVRHHSYFIILRFTYRWHGHLKTL